jgi:ATP-dependent Lhr-like helicase
MVSVDTPSLFPPDELAPSGATRAAPGARADDPSSVPDLAGLGFHPAVATWFARRFPDGATDAQRDGWAQIAAGRDTLVAAPTGSGKTLAGFLVGIDRLYRAHARGEPVGGRAQVAYVSPLKALAVDIAENLERPLREIAEVAAELGLDAPELRVGVRTGDTTASERAAMVRRPPNFVITTPESLYLLVTAARSRAVLQTIDTVIVDEIHALARDKRGSHLALTLERVERACAARPQRIGLSATQRPVSLIADLLCGTGAPEPCAIVDTGHQRTRDLGLELPQGELEAVASAEQMGDVVDRIADLVTGHRTTLVFFNTRRLAERLAHQLGEKLGDDVVAAHHGSLSKDRRYRVESRLRAGDLRALVATASLELGIDVGPVELVCQIGSPRSIATFLQRVGRANHSLRGVPKGRLFPLTRDELVESAALLLAVEKGHLDAVVPPDAPLDILAQQIVAEVAAVGPVSRPAASRPAESSDAADAPAASGATDVGPDDLAASDVGESWQLDDLFSLVRRAHPYRDLPRATFDQVIETVSRGIETGRGRRAAYLHLDAVNGEVRARPGARLAALTSGGAIPEIGDFRVVLEPDDLFVGTVNEDWATESMAGDIFLLGTHSWQIRQVGAGVVRVVDAEGKPPTIPFWMGEAPARTPELSREVSALRATLDGHLAAGAGGADRARSWLGRAAPLGDAAVDQIVDYVAAGRAVLGVVPTHDDLVFERFFDEAEGMHLVVHSPYGGRVNRALGLALRKRFCVSFDFELQAAANDDAVVLSLGPQHSFPLADVPRFLHSNTVREVLQQAVLSPPSPMFQSRWRWNLNRSLVVLRFKGGRRNPPPIQRMESDDLMAALFPQAAACQENVAGPIEIPDHPIVRQTMHDTLTEGLDIDGLTELLDGIEGGRVEVHFRDTTEASAFSHEILTAKPYAFLDDAEAQDRRTNAVPLRRGLPVDLETIGRLDPEAIDRVRDEVAPAPRSADELHDLLLGLVVMPAHEPWRGLFDQLADRGRVQSAVASGRELWWATENGGAVGALVGDVAPSGAPGVVATAVPPREQAAAAALRGHLDISGPLTAPALVERTGLDEAAVTVGLALLESDGFALRGQFTAHAGGPGPVPGELAPGGSVPGDDRAPDGGQAPGGGPHAGEPAAPTGDDAPVEWCARRLLARMHGYSRKRRRAGVEAVTAQDFMRFLLRWQHVAPGTQVRGHHGVRAVVEQLQGYEAAVATWEPHVLARRVDGYRPGMLDRLCHDGEVTWLRLSVTQPASDRKASPSKATPVTLAFRDDLPWLLQAGRLDAEPQPPELGATAEVVEVLDQRGACFVSELATATGRLVTDLETALWDGVARGLLTADGFAAIRALVDPRASRGPSPVRSVSRRRRGGRSTTTAAGRWSLVPPAEPVDDRESLAEVVADQLLQRWGVVVRDLAVHDGLPVPWRDVQWALRRFEDRGLVRGGRFVAGFSGEQYALPAAIDGLKEVRRLPRSGDRVTVNACDPLNLTGVILRGVARVPAVRTNSVTYVDGVPEGAEAPESFTAADRSTGADQRAATAR